MSPSEWLAITKYFRNATFDADQKSWKVVDFNGNTEVHEPLQRAIAAIISRRELMNLEERRPKQKQEANIDDIGGGRTAYEELAKEYGFEGDDEIVSENEDEETLQGGLVQPQQIKLIVPKEAKIKLYPRSLRCDKCGYYTIPKDAGKITSLACKKCKVGRMRQLSLLFFCDRCGLQQEITPVSMDADKDGPEFRCGEHGCNGILHLEMGQKLTDMTWKCGTTQNRIDEVRFNCRFCSDFTNKRFKRMELVPTTKSYLRPMTSAFVYFGDDKKMVIDGEDISWRLSEAGTSYEEQRQTLEEYGIADINVLDAVESIVAVYGYAPYGDDIKITFFKDKSRETGQFEYKAYITKTRGKGAVVDLDKGKVCDVVIESMRRMVNSVGNDLANRIQKYSDELKDGTANIDEVYSWLSELTKASLKEGVDSSNILLGLFRILHSIEHLLTYQAAIVTGLEENSFGGMVMIDRCAILIYERANVGAGGIDYIYKEKLLDWINEAVSYVRDCRYDCREGCVKCLFIRDPMCHPFWPTEVDSTYILPNSLLSRTLVNELWGLPTPRGEGNASS